MDPPKTTSEQDQRAVAELKASMGAGCPTKPTADFDRAASALRAAPAVQIDEGIFKYVLIEATDPSGHESRFLVRGALKAPYHVDVARPTVTALQAAGCSVDVRGGGRIKHGADKRIVEIFGFSYGFGPADHTVTQRLIQEDPKFAGYEVTITDEEY